MESVTIKGQTYHNDYEYNEIHDGVVYVCDQNQCGIFALSEEGLKKYFDGAEGSVEDMRETGTHAFFDEFGSGDYDPQFPYHFVFFHGCGVIDPETGELDKNTPHGEAYSEEFVSWFNSFPVEVFSDNENVTHYSFCDG